VDDQGVHRLPGAGDDVVIRATGANYTVTLDVAATVAGFTLNSANATFLASGRTFTVNGTDTLTAGSVLWQSSTWAGSGTLTNQAGMTVQGSSSISSPFQQDGSVLIQGNSTYGTATLTAASGFTNAGTITLQANYGYASDLAVSSGILTSKGLSNPLGLAVSPRIARPACRA
jgi:hypothetical protein